MRIPSAVRGGIEARGTPPGSGAAGYQDDGPAICAGAPGCRVPLGICRSIRIHDLRGTFASLLVSAGVPLFHVAKALGHSSQETTMRYYAHLAPGAAREMPNILERFVFGERTGQDANQMRTEATAGKASGNIQ